MGNIFKKELTCLSNSPTPAYEILIFHARSMLNKKEKGYCGLINRFYLESVVLSGFAHNSKNS
jgi:hypothetical protein